jgi:hypothetical protein
MPKGRIESPLTLPWESRGAWLRDLVSGPRIRLVPIGAAVVLALWGGTAVAIEEQAVRDTRETIDDVHRAIDGFRLDYGRCPTTMRELVHPPRTGVDYLEREPLDAWGNPLWVRCPARYDALGADVVSAGPSGSFLDADNIQ